MTKEDIMTAQEISEILGIKLESLYDNRYRKRTGIPVYKMGKYLQAIKARFWAWHNQRAKVA